MSDLDPFTRELDTLRGLRVFFAHHSVGRDILDGLDELLRTREHAVHIGGAPIGKNGDPLGKIADFEERVIADDSDIALMKLCFADFTPDTNVDGLLEAYAKTVARLKAARPGIVVVHTTPPLHARQVDLKSRINRAVGRLVWEDQANRRRLEIGEKLKAAFPHEPLFDLSLVESTRPDGSREMHLVDGRLIPMLWPGYTTDGGHLNVDGRRVAARAFVKALAHASMRVQMLSATSPRYIHTGA